MANAFRHVVSVGVILILAIWLVGCQHAVPAGNGQWNTTVTVVCNAPGWSSEEVESEVTVPLETSLAATPGLQRISSVSRSAESVIWVTFGPDTATRRARQIVAEQVKKVELRENVEVKLAPVSSDKMLLIVLRNDTHVETAQAITEQAVWLRDFADNSLRQRLLTLTGVSQVFVAGGRRKQYQIVPDAAKLAAFDMTPSELATALRETSGELSSESDEEVLIRTVGQLEVLDDIADTAIATSPDGAVVRVKDVASVRIGSISDGSHEISGLGKRDATDERAVVLAVQAQPTADKTAVNKKIDELLKQVQQQLPRGVEMQRKVDPRFEQLVRRLIATLQRELPPHLQLERRSSEQFGDILAIVPSRRITAKLYGPDLSVLREKADEVLERMKEVPGVVNPRVHPQPKTPELHIEIDGDLAARFGVTSEQVADAVRPVAGGHVVSRIRQGDREYDLVMQRADEARQIADAARQIADAAIRTQSGALIQVGQVAKVTMAAVPSAVCREDFQRVIFVDCEVHGRRLVEVESDIEKAVGPLPVGYFMDVSH